VQTSSPSSFSCFPVVALSFHSLLLTYLLQFSLAVNSRSTVLLINWKDHLLLLQLLLELHASSCLAIISLAKKQKFCPCPKICSLLQKLADERRTPAQAIIVVKLMSGASQSVTQFRDAIKAMPNYPNLRPPRRHGCGHGRGVVQQLYQHITDSCPSAGAQECQGWMLNSPCRTNRAEWCERAVMATVPLIACTLQSRERKHAKVVAS